MPVAKNVSYRVHLGYKGWTKEVKNGATAGNMGSRCAVQVVSVAVEQAKTSVQLYYSGEGWSDIYTDSPAGVQGKAKNIYGIRILAQSSDGEEQPIFYRVCGLNRGWSDWKSNGDMVFSDVTPITGLQIRMDAPQISDDAAAYLGPSLEQAICSADYAQTTQQPFVKFGADEDGTSGFFNRYTTLDALALQYGTDKSSRRHNYTAKYDFFLQQFKELPITVLELGVFRGASLKMWSSYFTNASIFGVDINEACRKYAGQNRTVLIRDVSDVQNLTALAQLRPHVIIDDASHYWSHQIKALCVLFPALRHGGVYILEDLETNFPSFNDDGYKDASVTAYEVLAALAELVTSRERLTVQGKNPAILRMAERLECLAADMEMVSFIHGSCIIVKR